jgi:hypothetical protein
MCYLGPTYGALQPTLAELVESLRVAVHTKQSKNVDVLHLSSRICRRMKGKQFDYLILDMRYSVHFHKVLINTPTNAQLIYYIMISLHVSTLLGHHQNTKNYRLKYIYKIFLSVCVCGEGKC